MNNWADPIGPRGGEAGFESWDTIASPKTPSTAPKPRSPLSCPPPKGSPRSGGCAQTAVVARHNATPVNQRRISPGNYDFA